MVSFLVKGVCRQSLPSEIAVSLRMEEKYGDTILARLLEVGKRRRTTVRSQSEELDGQIRLVGTCHVVSAVRSDSPNTVK